MAVFPNDLGRNLRASVGISSLGVRSEMTSLCPRGGLVVHKVAPSVLGQDSCSAPPNVL